MRVTSSLFDDKTTINPVYDSEPVTHNKIIRKVILRLLKRSVNILVSVQARLCVSCIMIC